MDPENKTLLGIDYGTKRVGTALSKVGASLAFAHDVLLNTKTLVEDVVKLCNEYDVEIIVIGESRNLKGEKNPLMKDIEAFVQKLKEHVSTPIVYEPEFFTSVQAARFQGEHEKLDASAAAIILQSFIDRHIIEK